MSIINKSDEELFKIAEPIWANLVKSSNIKTMVVLLKTCLPRCFMGQMRSSLASNGLTMNLYRHCQKAVRLLAALEGDFILQYCTNRPAPRYQESSWDDSF